MAISHVPSIKGLARSGMTSGGWLKSASMTTKMSPVAERAPTITDLATPLSPSRAMSRTGYFSCHLRTCSRVPSVEPSSTINTSRSYEISSISATMRERRSSIFPASFMVGTIIETLDNSYPSKYLFQKVQS